MRLPKAVPIIVFIFLALVACEEVHAGNLYKELNIIGGYSDVNKWTGKSNTLKNSLGFEYFNKFSNDYGDFLTADLQVRFAYDSLESSND